MNDIFREHLLVDTLVYLDDIILFAQSIRRTIDVFDRNLGILIDAKLKAKTRKTQLFRDKFIYLGYEVSSDGIAPDPA